MDSFALSTVQTPYGRVTATRWWSIQHTSPRLKHCKNRACEFSRREETGGSLDKHHGLRTWNFKTAPAANISASQHVVDSNQVVTRLLEASAIHFVRPSGGLRFLSSL